jgi:hypothetical protein
MITPISGIGSAGSDSGTSWGDGILPVLSELGRIGTVKTVTQRAMIRELEALLIHAMGLRNIRTYADNTWTDNLLALPECSD